MSDAVQKNLISTIKTTAVFTAVVFFLLGLCSCKHAGHHRGGPEHSNAGLKQKHDNQPTRRVPRRRAGDYSRLPGNYPADWQRSTIGR